MIVEVPVPYQALVVPPRSQNERRAMLVAKVALRIPPASEALRVAARLHVGKGEKEDVMARDGVVEYFAESDGTLLERMPTCRVHMGDVDYAGSFMASGNSCAEADLPLDQAIRYMTGGEHHALSNLQHRLYWNPFQPRPAGFSVGPGFEVLAPEEAPQRSVAALAGVQSRAEAIEAAHEAAAAMRSLPDGRILIPSMGPVWRFESNNPSYSTEVSGDHTVKAVRIRHSIKTPGPDANWSWDVRGDRGSDMLGMCPALGCAVPSQEILDSIEVLDRSVFAVDDRSVGWRQTARLFLQGQPASLRDLWGNINAGEQGWETPQVISAMLARDAVRAGDPYEAARHCAELIAARPELRGKGRFDAIEAQARRVVGEWEPDLGLRIAAPHP